MRAPRLTAGVKVTSFSFSPFEGYILSSFDGVASLQEVADSTGATLAQVQAVAERLEAVGALEWVERGPSREPSQEQPKPKRPPSDRHDRPGRASWTPSRGIVRTKPVPPDAPRQLYDPVELEEPNVDLDADRRREILDTFYRLDHVDHYTLLGVERDADKKDVREAYFRLSKLFHPDTLYGKRLGTYKTKMEVVFRRLTDAYEVLGKSKKRERYDDYLRAKDLAEKVRTGLAAGEEAASSVERATHAVAVDAVVEPTTSPSERVGREPSGPPPASAPPPPKSASSSPPKSTPTTRPPSVPPRSIEHTRRASEPPTSSRPDGGRPASPVPPPSSGSIPRLDAPPSVSARRPLDDDAKRQLARDLLERRLKGATGRGSSSSSTASPSTPPPKRPSSDPAEPADKDALLRGLATSLKHAARMTGGADKAERHVRDATAAERRGDLVAAVNSLRLAVALAPERDELAHELERLRHLLAKQLAETYERQASYEEEQGAWGAAARSWIKVAEGRPERAVYPMRAAMALLKEGKDLKLGKELAERAVALAPEDARARCVLAEVFLKAGMRANARRELDAAAKLDPDADFVKNLLRELK